MKAWQVQGAGAPGDVLRWVDVEPLAPGPGQVVIDVRAAGIGLPDVFMCQGHYPLTPPLPFTPGQEVAGTVAAVGEGVDRPVGQRVMGVTAFYLGHGSFAEQCLADAGNIREVPEALVVLGASGGSGTAAVQLGVALGARVVGVVSDEAKAAFSRDLGATEAVVIGDQPVAPRVRDALGGPADLVFDPVGGALAEDVVTALGRNGRFLLIGFASGRWPSIDPHELVRTNTSLVGVIAGGQSTEELDRVHAELGELVRSGRLRNSVTATPAFAELPAALRELADRRVVGKQVLVR
jgi:NADPH2:quinone reductase